MKFKLADQSTISTTELHSLTLSSTSYPPEMFRVLLLCLFAVATNNAAAQDDASNKRVIDALAASELTLANLEQVLQAQPPGTSSIPEVVKALAASELALANLEQVVQGKPSIKLKDVEKYPRAKRFLFNIGYKVGGWAGSLVRHFTRGKNKMGLVKAS